VNAVMVDVGGATAAAWGVAHLVPTRKVAAGFGPISEDNRHIITMEWIAEGAFLRSGSARPSSRPRLRCSWPAPSS